jgi:hypothetical protein
VSACAFDPDQDCLDPEACGDEGCLRERAQAVEPEPEVRGNTYRVVGPTHEVHGAKPGETFTADLTAEQEAALVEGGHIEPVEAQPSDDTPEEG